MPGSSERRPLRICGPCTDGGVGGCRIGIAADLEWSPEHVRAVAVCPPGEAGGPRVAHGGWVAKAFDEVLAQVPIYLERSGITRELMIRYHKPVPVERELAIDARLVTREGRDTVVHGELRLAATEVLLASAEAVFVHVDRHHFRRHEQWLADQEPA